MENDVNSGEEPECYLVDHPPQADESTFLAAGQGPLEVEDEAWDGPVVVRTNTNGAVVWVCDGLWKPSMNGLLRMFCWVRLGEFMDEGADHGMPYAD